jgi:hypothetical protein
MVQRGPHISDTPRLARESEAVKRTPHVGTEELAHMAHYSALSVCGLHGGEQSWAEVGPKSAQAGKSVLFFCYEFLFYILFSILAQFKL